MVEKENAVVAMDTPSRKSGVRVCHTREGGPVTENGPATLDMQHSLTDKFNGWSFSAILWKLLPPKMI